MTARIKQQITKKLKRAACGTWIYKHLDRRRCRNDDVDIDVEIDVDDDVDVDVDVEADATCK